MTLFGIPSVLLRSISFFPVLPTFLMVRDLEKTEFSLSAFYSFTARTVLANLLFAKLLLSSSFSEVVFWLWARLTLLRRGLGVIAESDPAKLVPAVVDLVPSVAS